MELLINNNIIEKFNLDNDQVFILSSINYNIISNNNISNRLSKIIDILGEKSAKVKQILIIQAQGLKQIITNWNKFINSNQSIYLKIEENKIIAFLKVGFKKLFFWNEINKIHEITPLCVLDFYVNEEFQRHGVGKVINLS